MERERLKNEKDSYPYILTHRETPLGRVINLPDGTGFHILNPQKIGTIVSYSDYISPKEKLSILIFVTIRHIRGKLCL